MVLIISYIYHSKNIYKILVTETWVGGRMYCMGLKQHPIIVVLIVIDFQEPYGKGFREMFSYVKFCVNFVVKLW